MKKILVILISTTLLLSGCAPKNVPNPEISIDNFDNSGEKTVLYYGKKSFPLSFSKDGIQQIQSGTYWYYELENLYSRDWDEAFYTYNLKSCDLNGVKEYKEIVKEKCFATNGNWPLFLTPVHSEYSLENQKMVDETLIKSVQKQLSSNGIEGGKAIITDTWHCDMDGDGKEEVLFKASNEEDGQNVYEMLAYAKEEDCQVLFSDYSLENGEEMQKITPMVCDLNGDGKWGVVLYKSGEYESFISYEFNGGNFAKNYEIIF